MILVLFLAVLVPLIFASGESEGEGEGDKLVWMKHGVWFGFLENPQLAFHPPPNMTNFLGGGGFITFNVGKSGEEIEGKSQIINACLCSDDLGSYVSQGGYCKDLVTSNEGQEGPVYQSFFGAVQGGQTLIYIGPTDVTTIHNHNVPFFSALCLWIDSNTLSCGGEIEIPYPGGTFVGVDSQVTFTLVREPGAEYICNDPLVYLLASRKYFGVP